MVVWARLGAMPFCARFCLSAPLPLLAPPPMGEGPGVRARRYDASNARMGMARVSSTNAWAAGGNSRPGHWTNAIS